MLDEITLSLHPGMCQPIPRPAAEWAGGAGLREESLSSDDRFRLVDTGY